MNRKKVRNFNRLKKCPLFWIAYLKFNDKVNELKDILEFEEYEEGDEDFIISEIDRYDNLIDLFYDKLMSLVSNKTLDIKLDKMSKPYALYEDVGPCYIMVDKYYSIYYKGILVRLDWDAEKNEMIIIPIKDGEISYKLEEDIYAL